eukprot:CAMPEP_0178473044 /NCGR_PEP_ID=MMETSP0696-20121128/1881_1 /TAXON_ID=265572 /ORGANISM="Extubocellulus spinifer, Strain CCMP396" /LENGTH=135 /DNA_ID=CAMNT_0020100249 /DNA_START=236 /DNA_END=643 /DNA_ORIENTATION=-
MIECPLFPHTSYVDQSGGDGHRTLKRSRNECDGIGSVQIVRLLSASAGICGRSIGCGTVNRRWKGNIAIIIRDTTPRVRVVLKANIGTKVASRSVTEAIPSFPRSVPPACSLLPTDHIGNSVIGGSGTSNAYCHR